MLLLVRITFVWQVLALYFRDKNIRVFGLGHKAMSKFDVLMELRVLISGVIFLKHTRILDYWYDPSLYNMTDIFYILIFLVVSNYSSNYSEDYGK